MFYYILMFQVPILLIVYKRPSTTQTVFNAIREIQPSKLFVFADGPKQEHEKALCNETKSIISKIDWDCDVKTYFSEANLGCGLGPKTAIDWFFEHACL